MWVATVIVLPPTVALEIEPSVGGIYKLIMPGDFCMTGHCSVVETNKKPVYSWQWRDDNEITEIKVLFTQASAQTQVQLSQPWVYHEGSQTAPPGRVAQLSGRVRTAYCQRRILTGLSVFFYNHADRQHESINRPFHPKLSLCPDVSLRHRVNVSVPDRKRSRLG